jgi:membrane protease YdiL (CAAX protease family)
MLTQPGYLRATRHPYPCLLFVLPLLAGYEAGVWLLGGTRPEMVRNGADNWLRWALGAAGYEQDWLPPVALLLLFIAWSWLREGDRPYDVIGTLTGMVVESIVYALGLWSLSRTFGPLLEHYGIELTVGPQVEATLLQLVPYVGAGIYEEAVFRLFLFSVLAWLFARLELPLGFGTLLAAVVSAVLFSVAHHVGPYGQPYTNYLFLFRVVAGFYFALLFQLRGFGVAVGTHATYNVLVAVAAGG